MPKSGSKTPTADLMDARYGKLASERYNLGDEMQYDPAGKNLLGRIGEAARSTNARIRNTPKVNKLDEKLDKIDRSRANERSRAATSRFMRGEDPGAGRLDVVDPKYMSGGFYNRNYGTEYRDVTSSVKKFSSGGDVRFNPNRGKTY